MAGVGVAAVVGSTQSFHQQEMRTERSERMELKTPEGDLGDVEADFQTLVNEMARDGSASCSASSMKKQQSFSSTVTKQTFSSSSISNSSSNSSRVLTSSVNGTVGHTKANQISVGPPKEAPPPPPPGPAAGGDVVTAVLAGGEGVVTAVLAQVVPEDATQRGRGESEIVVEQPMRVRDRIRRIEKQLSTEEVPAGPPEVLLPRARSGSVKNLAEQFTHADEQAPPAPPTVNAAAFKQARGASIEGEVLAVGGDFRSVKEMVSSFSQQEETSSVRRVEGEFRSVKETASIFQDPIQPMTAPIRPPAAFLTDGEAEEVEVEVAPPVAVLPPATMARPAPPAPPVPPIPPPETVVLPPEVVPLPHPPVPTAPAYSTLLPEPTPIYDFAPMPEPAPAPTPPAPQPIIPAFEPAPAVPPRDAKPGAPPPVPWRKNREDKPEPPPAPEVKPAPTEPAPVPIPAPTPAPQDPPLPPPPPQELQNPQASQALPLQDTPVPEPTLVQPPPPLVPEQPSTSVSTSVSTSTSTSASTLISTSTSTSTSVAAAETEKVFEEALAEINKYSETLSQTSTSRSTSAETVVHQPIQYSAQVKCEVRSRVNTPEVPEQPTPPPPQQQQMSSSSSSSSQTSFTKKTKTEMKTSSSSSFASSVASANSTTAVATKISKPAAAATITAKTAAKPPKFEASSGGNEPGPPKYSLLRSASTGSMGTGEGREGRMRHAGSDKDLPKFNVKKVKDGLTSNARVWSPGKFGEDKGDGPSKIDLPDLPSFKDQPTVWSPTRAGSASPSLGRRGEYRKVAYEGQGGLQKRPSQENINTPRAEESYAWKDICVDKVSARSPTSALPKVQNPTVTLLQKKREGQIPGKRPEYLKPDDLGPKYKPDDKLYVIKREYESEDESGGRRFAVLGPKKVAGVGPTTTDGVPVTLKSGIKSEHQGEWYRRMFDSLHKIKDARYGGYMSEPEGYDSDVGSSRYATFDHRRPLHHFQVDPMTSSLPRECLIDLDPYSRNTSRYVHQPGRIEDYVPGYSSLSDKELKRSKSQEPPVSSANHRIGSQMSMTHALKESGYESDSTLVFKKREDARRQAPDPRKTSQQYRQIQRGGDIPFTGLQKPNPPRPRESPYKYEAGEVNIHYRTPVRIEQKEAIPEEELARRQEEHMKKVYENERRKKYLAELEDIERRRHTDNFTPLQKSPIPLNRYDDESSLGTLRGGARTPDVKQVARALYNFTAQNKRELTFNKGDVVYIRRQIDKNWYEGELRGSVGIFPCNYVEIVPYENVKTMTRKPTEGQARARFNFQAQTSMEMSLSKGELVVLSRRVDENWYEGRIGNRKGIFPVSYVDTLVEPGCNDRPMSPSSSPLPRPALPAATLLYNGASSYSSPYSTLGRPGSQNDNRPYHQSLTVNTQQEPIPYRALYNYKPQNDDELELVEGDLVMVMEKCDDGWFVGTSRRTGLFGTFPGNYVEKV